MPVPVCVKGGGGGHQMNKFEQVFIDGHQMLLGGGTLYSEVQCIMGNGHMGTPMDRLTH